MEQCTVRGMFPMNFSYALARNILREFTYKNLQEFKCVPSEERIQEYLKTKFFKQPLIAEHSIKIFLTHEESMNTVSSLSMTAYEPVGKKRKCTQFESAEFKRLRLTSDEILQCSICLYNIHRTGCKLSCGCKFHTHCVKKAYLYNKRCPLCYEPINFWHMQ